MDTFSGSGFQRVNESFAREAYFKKPIIEMVLGSFIRSCSFKQEHTGDVHIGNSLMLHSPMSTDIVCEGIFTVKNLLKKGARGR